MNPVRILKTLFDQDLLKTAVVEPIPNDPNSRLRVYCLFDRGNEITRVWLSSRRSDYRYFQSIKEASKILRIIGFEEFVVKIA